MFDDDRDRESGPFSYGSGYREWDQEMTFFEKQMGQITLEDVNWLVTTEVKESQEVEFKRELSGEKNVPDPWQSGSGRVGRTAITALVKEAPRRFKWVA